jgi:uncharacterized protein involved in exopolysaccharide biosynthesis
MTQQQATVEPVSISEYISMLSKHKLLIIFCLLLGFSAALLIGFTTPSRYEATAKLTIKPPANSKTASLTDATGSVDSLFFQEQTLNTHLELIRSGPMLEKLIDKLKLDQRNDTKEQEGLHQFINQLKTNIRLLLIGEKKVLTAAERRYLLAESLKKNITIENAELTNILNITVEDYEPEMASNIANTLAELYIQYDIGNNQLASSNSFIFLKDQIAEFKIKLDQAEADFLAYRQKENMFSLETTQAGIEEKKKSYDTLLLDTRNKQQQIAMRLNELESLAGDKKKYAVRLRTLLGNPVIDNLNSQLIAAEIEQSKLSKIYRSKHAEMQAIQTTISDLQMELNRQIEKEINNMKKEKEMLQASIEEIKNSTEELKKEAIAISGKGKQYLILEDNVKTYKKYYETLISKIEDMSVSSEIRNAVTNINFVEHAQKPIYPTKPNKLQIVLAGIFGGLFSGIGLALLLEFSDRSIRTEEDVQSCCFNISVIGIIPIANQAVCRNNLAAEGEGGKGA